MTRKTPVLLEPSNLNIADPNSCDLAKAAFNFATLKARPESIWPIFSSASTQISAGSQQFINRSPYVVSERIKTTALMTTLWILLSDMEIAYPVMTDQYLSVYRRVLSMVGRLNRVGLLRTMACNIIVERLLPTRENIPTRCHSLISRGNYNLVLLLKIL